MANWERRLLDPPPDIVAEVVYHACLAPFDSRGLPHWRLLVARLWREAGGRRSWTSQGTRGSFNHFSLSWWTDAIGRRHVRIERKTASEDQGSWLPDDEDPRPPLAHVYPERVFCRQRDGASVWLASCACGATDAPDALVWMGRDCGACHDRGEESAPEQQADLPTSWTGPPGAAAVLFSPDGRLLAVADGQRVVNGWDVRTGASRVLIEADATCQLRGLAWSPDGTLLAVADTANSRVLVHDLVRNTLDILQDAPRTGALECIAFRNDHQFCLGGQTNLVFWTRVDGQWRWDGCPLLSGGANSVASAAQGEVVAIGCDLGIYVMWQQNRKRNRMIRFPAVRRGFVCDFLTFLDEGETVLAVTRPALAVEDFSDIPLERSLNVINVDQDNFSRMPGGVVFPLAGCLDLSPDKRYLAGVVHLEDHSPARVVFWEVPCGREVAALEWDPNAVITDLAFCPDNETLATAQRGGTVKLWPWRRLLEA